jgi:hypothetical protein
MLTEKEIENSKYKDIYYKNLHDKDTEFFWYCFKESIDNLINNLENNKQKELQYLIDELNDKCNLLNQLQKNEKYDDINLEIEKYIKYIARVLFLPHANVYYFNIFITNLKRWSKWVLKISPAKFNYHWLKDDQEDYFMIFFQIKKSLVDNDNDANNYQTLFTKINHCIGKYLTISSVRNRNILYDIYRLILEEKYLKPQILIDLSEYFPIKEDLIKMGYLKDDLPSNWSLEKAIKKGRV